MENKIYNEKTNEATEKDIKNLTNQNNGNSNIVCTYLKFVSFTLTIDQIIQNHLQF